jgi:hypothetical protein
MIRCSALTSFRRDSIGCHAQPSTSSKASALGRASSTGVAGTGVDDSVVGCDGVAEFDGCSAGFASGVASEGAVRLDGGKADFDEEAGFGDSEAGFDDRVAGWSSVFALDGVDGRLGGERGLDELAAA